VKRHIKRVDGNNYSIYKGDCLDVLPLLKSESVNLVVTSPPYNALQEYEDDLSEEEYEEFITNVFTRISRVLKPDARICWIVAPTISRKNREFPFPLEYITIKAACNSGIKFWESIVWDQGHSEAHTAWGSWQSASAPFIRHKTERVLLFVKNTRRRISRGVSNKFGDKEFEHSTLDVWNITPCKDRVHPCSFPLALAKRCIKMFSYVDDVVLDLFMGVGTTGIACSRLKRFFIGIEKKHEYFIESKKRLVNLIDFLKVDTND